MAYWKQFLIAFAAIIVVRYILSVRKNMKDPDVIDATKLGMDVREYLYYKELAEEYEKAIYSLKTEKEQNDYFKNFVLPKIKNPNKWYKVTNYRLDKSMEERSNSFF